MFLKLKQLGWWAFGIATLITAICFWSLLSHLSQIPPIDTGNLVILLSMPAIYAKEVGVWSQTWIAYSMLIAIPLYVIAVPILIENPKKEYVYR